MRSLRMLLLTLTILLAAGSASAQYRNNAIAFKTGWSFLGSTDFINKSYGLAWGATDQFLLGAGIKSAIGYQAYFEADATLGFGGGVNLGAVAKTVVGLYISSGVRYNFLEEKHRPFVAGHVQYLQLLNIEGTDVETNAALGGAALWVGLRPVVGYEFFFIEENSLQLSASPIVYLNLDQAPKFGADLHLTWNAYF